MRYHHKFRIRAPLKRVAEFHRRAASMAVITPPPILVRMGKTPSVLEEGNEMEFTMWLGPLPVRWRARIEDVSPTGFTDRQLAGPFAEWIHRHSFADVDLHTTIVLDEISLKLRRHLLWGPVGFGMLLGLPVLFGFRAWKTKRLLTS